jgi:coenzyme F420 biosynthesis associated uncharacterized protein
VTAVVEPAPADPGGIGGESPPGADVIDWESARRVARWVQARKPAAAVGRDVEPHFAELTARAEEMVIASTGLRPVSAARGRVIDRAGWVDANVASMQRLLAPSLARFAERRAAQPVAGRMPKQLAGAGRAMTGAQMGAILGWMSTRVLGQYDLLITDTESADASGAVDQDVVYYVGPNVLALEQRFGFDPNQFRLWLALHEVTHRCQFTGVPWLREYFMSLVDQGLEPLAADPNRLLESLRRAATEIRAGRSPIGEIGVIGLIATPEQLDAIGRIQALMSLLEGHGDVTMDRAGLDEVPDAPRFSRVLRERRQQVRGLAKVLQHLLGIEAKMRQYEQGERFVRAVEDAGGRDLFDRVWQGPEWLPTLPEIRNPADWVARVRDPAGVAS